MADSHPPATAPSPAVATITVLHPEGDSGRGLQVRDRPVVIGRDSGCDLVLTSAGVSRRHASIRRIPRYLLGSPRPPCSDCRWLRAGPVTRPKLTSRVRAVLRRSRRVLVGNNLGMLPKQRAVLEAYVGV